MIITEEIDSYINMLSRCCNASVEARFVPEPTNAAHHSNFGNDGPVPYQLWQVH